MDAKSCKFSRLLLFEQPTNYLYLRQLFITSFLFDTKDAAVVVIIVIIAAGEAPASSDYEIARDLVSVCEKDRLVALPIGCGSINCSRIQEQDFDQV